MIILDLLLMFICDHDFEQTDIIKSNFAEDYKGRSYEKIIVYSCKKCKNHYFLHCGREYEEKTE